MARISISIPDEAMHTRITSNQDNLNFSLLARQAFDQAFRLIDAGKLGAVEETIERLRQSKEENKTHKKEMLRRRARAWVREDASYAAIKTLEETPFDPTKNMFEQLGEALYGENYDEAQEWFDDIFANIEMTNADVFEFLVAVGKVWSEIKDRVEAEEKVAAAA
ncbi:hypothetical protein [Aurantimonas sp. NFXS3]|uniref:hypothetical protein n=1 Tax=Aurantimonas sp. NFXS3 TaxID=2818434 RepID=UPI003B8C7377